MKNKINKILNTI